MQRKLNAGGYGKQGNISSDLYAVISQMFYDLPMTVFVLYSKCLSEFSYFLACCIYKD